MGATGRAFVGANLVLAVQCIVPPALAQSSPSKEPPGAQAPTNTPPDQSATQDIIVTAQRREERLSRTAVSVKVLTSAQLAEANIVTQHDLQTVTPGLQVRSQRDGEELNFSLRGQSQDAFSGTRPGVLPYFNEVQIAGQLSSSSLYDLQSVQVLKGPQGTLFGRSATGGAVLYATAKPTETWSGYASALAGNYDQQQFEGALSGPLISDAVLGRVALYYGKRDGFQTDTATGANVGGIKRFGARGSLTIKFAPAVRNELVVDYFHATGQPTVAVINGIFPYTGNGAPYVPAALLLSGTDTPQATNTGECTLQSFAGFPGCAATGGPLPQVAAFYTNYFSQPNHPTGGLAGYLATQLAEGPYRVNVDPSSYRQRNLLLSDTLTWDISPTLILKNIIGFGRLRLNNVNDSDGTPFRINLVSEAQDYTDQASDELQLQGHTGNERLTYSVGAYVANEKQDVRYSERFFDIVFGGFQQINHFISHSRTYAGYAQATYKLNDHGLSATGGIRYTSERQTLDIGSDDVSRATLGPIPPAGYAYHQSEVVGSINYTLGLQEQLTNSLLIYGVTRQANKSGGFNGLLPPKIGSADQGGNAFGTERVRDVEFGIKFAGTLGALPAQANLAYFHSWDKNSQRNDNIALQGSLVSFTANVPEAQVDGIEFDGSVAPTSRVKLGANFAYTRARYTNGNLTLFGILTKYDQVTDTPEFSGSAYVDFSVPLGGRAQLRLHGDVYGQGETHTVYTSLDQFGSNTPAYVLANFRVTLELDQRLSFTANLRNAFDRVYYTGGNVVGPVYQVNTLVPGEPRTITFTAKYKF